VIILLGDELAKAALRRHYRFIQGDCTVICLNYINLIKL